MDVTFNIESTRQYFQGVPTQSVYPTPWPPNYQQQQQKQHQQFSRDLPPEHQQQSSQHQTPRLPSVGSFSNFPYRAAGGTLPSVSTLKGGGQGGFEGSSVPPRYPSSSAGYAPYYQQQQQQQLSSRDPQPSQQIHQQQTQQLPYQLTSQKQQQPIQSHPQTVQSPHQSQRSIQQGSQQPSQNHRINSPSNHQVMHGAGNHHQQQPPTQSHQNVQQNQQKSFHDTHQSLQNHAQIFQMQQGHKHGLPSHKISQQVLQSHQTLHNLQQSHSPQHQYQSHQQQAIQNHNMQAAIAKYQSQQQGIQNIHHSHHNSVSNIVGHHSQSMNHLSNSQQQTHHQQNLQSHPQTITRQSPHQANSQQSLTRQSPHQLTSQQSLTRQSPHQLNSQQSLTRQSPHQPSPQQNLTRMSPHQSNSQPSLTRMSPHQSSSQQSLTRQSPHQLNSHQGLTRQSPHQLNSHQGLMRQSPHLSHHQNLSSPSHHITNNQSGYTRHSPLHQQLLSRHSPHISNQQPPMTNMPSPSHMNHQQSITRQSPVTINHHQGLTSPSHLASNHAIPPSYSSHQPSNHQNLFTAPTPPIGGTRTTPQSTAGTASLSHISHVKKESPLDLSVKTIRQSADSTADQEHVYYTFHNEFIRGKASGSGMSQQIHQRPTVVAATRSEYQLQFGAPPLIQQTVEPKKSKEHYQPYQLPSVNSFNKNYDKYHSQAHHIHQQQQHIQQQQQLQQQQQQHHQQQQQHQQQQHQQQQQQQQQQHPNYHSQTQLPRMAYSTETKFPLNYLKRPSDGEKPVALSKIPRVDTWKQTFDQQIEKRFNSYLSSVNGGDKKPSTSASSSTYGQQPEQRQNGADKRVLSILRNSLETREARNQQVQQQKPVPQKYEPRIPTVPPRQNLPPFGAINLDRTTATFNRLHVPRAVDSFTSFPQAPPSVQDVVDITDDDEPPPPPPPPQQPPVQQQQHPQLQHQQQQQLLQHQQAHLNHQQVPQQPKELDGLAAFLAARIRTKAELKQVSTKDNNKAPTPTPGSSGGEQSSPRSTPIYSSSYDNKDLVKSFINQEGTSVNGNVNKNLTWNRMPKENNLSASSVPRRRDSDSEGAEIPLSDLRRGTHSIPSLPTGPPPQPIEISPEEEEEFNQWKAMCEEFMMQLKDCKGMRKKMKIKLEDGIYVKEEKDDEVESDRLMIDERQDSDGENTQTPVSSSKEVMANRKRQTKKPGPRKKKFKVVNRGWQEEVWQFKRSLQERSVTGRPSGWPRAPGSLPDLERLSHPPQEPAVEPDEDRKSVAKSLSEEKLFLDLRMRHFSARKKNVKKVIEKDPRCSSSELTPTPKSNERDTKKDTVAGFRESPAEGDLPPDLKPKNKDIKIRMKEIYDEERPASAPPPGMTKEELQRSSAIRKSKLVKKKKTSLLVKTGEAPRLIPEKKCKTIRRKLKTSSGFDYIRKKKKQTVKKDSEGPPREKKKKTAPMTEQEIQAEIKGWVLNKGIGETLLHRATKVGNVDVVHYLLEKLHHNPAPRDNAGYTPLHVACARGHIQVANLLLKCGASVSDSALGGVRPLHEAAENGFTKLVKLLLENGADPQLATYSGTTALSLATDDEAKHLMETHISNRLPLVNEPDEDEPGSSTKNEQSSERQEGDLGGVTSDIDGFEIEESSVSLPNLYRLANEPRTDSWVLFHELAPLLRVKTKEALLKQLGQEAKAVLRDMKLSEFYEKAHCRSIASSAGPKTSKLTLVKYTDTVKFLLGVDTTIIPR